MGVKRKGQFQEKLQKDQQRNLEIWICKEKQKNSAKMTHVDTVSSNYKSGFKDIKIKKTQTKTSLLKCLHSDHLSKGVENVSTQEPAHRYSEQFYS